MWVDKRLVLKLTGISGILLIILTILTIFTSIQITPWFSWAENAISDLGRIEAASSIFNIGIIILGILMIFFSYGVMYILKDKLIGLYLLSISGLLLIFIGLIPLPHIVHNYISVIFFITFPISFLFLGFDLYENERNFNTVMSVFAFFIVFLTFISPSVLLVNDGIAVSEAIILFPGFIWCFIFGLKILIWKKPI